jgi:signal transduction histidine kinase
MSGLAVPRITAAIPAAAGQAVLLGLAIAYAVGSEILRLGAGYSLTWVLADLLPGIAFFVVGLVAWRRRPGNRTGPLLFAVGLAWFVGTWSATTDHGLGRLASVLQGYYGPLLAWVVLAYPAGRLEGRAERLAVAGFFAALVGRSVLRLAVFPIPTAYNFAIPADVDRYVNDVSLRNDGEKLFGVVIAAVAVVVLTLVVRRLVRASGPGRRVAWPVLLGGIAIAVGTVLNIVLLFVQPDSDDMRIVLFDLSVYITSATGVLVPIAFLFGLARTRLARGVVADLVVQLDDLDRRPSLRDVLARALSDPSLELAFAVVGGGFVDADGRPVSLPDAEETGRAVTRLDRRGETIAALVHDPALSEERALIASVSAAARMALDNERLHAEVKAQLQEVRASRARIVAAGDGERRRIERDLHDGAQQRLVTLALAIQMARRRTSQADPVLERLLEDAGKEIDSALAELRELARGVHPSILAEAGLEAAVESLAERAPIPVRVTAAMPLERPSPEVEATAYFVVSESLANIAKHARATSARVSLEVAGDQFVATVRDDGIGGADASRGSGLTGLADRVAAVGGRLAVESPAGGGTTISAYLPWK